jgi:GTP-binding protein YchF
MKVCIIGLPQSGKTTLFHAIAGQHGEAGRHRPDELLRAVIRVPDKRLDRLAEIYRPEKNTHATFELEDVGPLFEERGGRPVVRPAALAAARDADGLIVVLGAFLGRDAVRDGETMRDELMLADLGQIEKRIDRLEKEMTKPSPLQARQKHEHEILVPCRETLEDGRSLRSLALDDEQEKTIRSFAFLTLKPTICVVNTAEGQDLAPPARAALDRLFDAVIAISAQIEREIMELEPAEREPFLREAGVDEPASGRIVRTCYETLDLCSFFTVGDDETRAWTVRRGDDALTAAGKIHTDIARGFIRAEVCRYEDLAEAGSLKEVRSRGKLRLEGKQYVVRDGDVIHFNFNV